jgi:hypothetical protein
MPKASAKIRCGSHKPTLNVSFAREIVKNQSNMLARDLAQVLEASAARDGCHLGPTDASVAAMALKRYATRRGRYFAASAATAGLACAVIANPAVATLAERAIRIYPEERVGRREKPAEIASIVTFNGARYRLSMTASKQSGIDFDITSVVEIAPSIVADLVVKAH